MNNLLPCPCCGKEAKVLNNPPMHYFMIHCIDWCVCTLAKNTIEETSATWNKRTNKDEK